MTDVFGSSYANMLGNINGMFDRRAQRQAGRAIAGGNYQAGADALLQNGDLQSGLAIQNAVRERQQADATRQWEFTVKATNALEGVLAQGGDVVAAYDSLAPVFQQMGTTPEQIQALRQSLAANPAQFLQSIKATVPVEYQFRDGGAGDVVRVDPRTGRAEIAYDAPDRPIATQFGIILPPGARGDAVPTPAGTQPTTGPAAISDSPLWQRQIQQESGGRQFDRQGNLITSPKGAFGIAQLMPGTAAELAPRLGVTPEQLRSDPALNERAGQLYMEDQRRKYGGNEALALAAYNAGPGRVDEWIQRFGDPRTGEITTEEFISKIPFAETKAYVGNILAGSGEPSGEVAQGDVSEQDATVDLGGGFRLQQMETPADRRATRAETRAEAAERRAQASFERQNAPVATLSPAEVSAVGLPEGTVAQRRSDGSINVINRGGSERYTEGQRQAAAFAYRMENGVNTLRRLSARGVARPSPAILAFGEGRIRENALSPSDRQWLQAAREAIAPVLRKDTGAAVTPQELVTYMGTYLASPTDDPATIQQKWGALERAQTALRAQGGGAYDEMFPQSGGGSSGQRRRQTNAPGLPFDISPGQLQTRQRLVQSGASPSAPVGTERNPRYMNPSDPNSSWTNARSGDYLVRPDGRLVRKP